jgi:hypothetical protein
VSPILGIWASAQQGALAVGDYESIATVNVGSGGASSIAFASIPSTYTHLQIRGIARSSTASSGIVPIYAQINSTSTNQTSHWVYGDGSTATATNATNANLIYLGYIGQNTTTASTFGAAVVDVLDYANTNKYKTFRILSGVDLSGSGRVGLFSGFLYANTNAISNITLYANAGGDSFAEYSSFALYGIKG